ncbi:MAG: CvpA family protein [Eubacteriales bacterium]|nr:CvpA family protein [Eubacteriales bacterium]
MKFYQFGSFDPGNNPFNLFASMFGGAGGQNASQEERTAPPTPPPRPRTTKKGKLLRLLVYLVVMGIVYYVTLPPINLQAHPFWSFAAIAIVFALAMLTTVSDGGSGNVFGPDGKPVQKPKKLTLRKGLLSLMAIGIVVYVICSLLSSPIFQAKAYSSIIADSITVKDISEYTPTIDNVPLLDRDSATRLANRTLGNLVDEVSQFELGESTQITMAGAPVRVHPLGYVSIVKWFLNRNTGIPAYITVDMKSQNTKIVRLEDGMRYSPSAFLNDRLERHLRFAYPTAMFDDASFELDEDGNPYWVVPVLKHRILLLAGTDVKGVVTCNPVTGETQYYPLGEIPDWIDNVYRADLIVQQYDWYGRYHNGFWNSIIGQKGVVQTTDGYNYIPKDNDVYCYTGVTSVVSDESNIAFIFSDMRTRETDYYEIAGAEEYSAMESAEGVVQHLNYQATFPLLLEIEGQPTYTVALKDAAGLVKMYGMVNMSQYQDVATGKTIKECLANYRQLLIDDGILSEEEVSAEETQTVSGKIADLRSAVRDGTTYYYIRLVDDGSYYALSASDNEAAVLLNIGDTVTLEVTGEGEICPAKLK